MSRCTHSAHRVTVSPGRTLVELRTLVEMAEAHGMPADSVVEPDTDPDHRGGLMVSLPGYDPALWNSNPFECPMTPEGRITPALT